MKKTQKVLSTIMTVAMLATAIPASTVQAQVSGVYTYDEAVSVEQWSITPSKSAMATDGTYHTYISPYAKTGNNSLYINYNKEKTSNYFVRVMADISENIEIGQTYEAEFWTYGDVPEITQTWSLKYQLGGAQGGPSKGETKNGWTRYYYSFTATEATTDNTAMIALVQGTGDFLIDDVSLKASGSETNLVLNGGFENVAVTDGSKVVAEEGGMVFKNYRTKFTTASGKNQNSFINYFRPTKRYARSGNYGVYVYHGTSDASNEMSINGDLKETLKAGTEYTIDFWTTNNVKLNSGFGVKLLNQAAKCPTTVTQQDGAWNQYSYTWTPTSDISGSYNWITVRFSNTFIIDDLRVYPATSSNPDEDNMLTDGGFENVTEYPYEKGLRADGWTLNKQLSDTSGSNAYEGDLGIRAFSGISSAAARGEGYGLELVMDYLSATSNCNVSISQPVTFSSDETYNLECYVKGNFGGKSYIKFGFGTSEKTLSNFTAHETTEDGWTRYTISDVAVSSGSTFRIAATWNVQGVCIDDVALTKSGDSTNLLINGSFDSVTNTSYKTVKPVFELLNDDGSINKSLTAVEAGTIQVTTAVRNINAGPALEALTLVAVYKDGVLYNVNMLERKYSESVDELPTDEWVSTVEIPESENGEKYTIKVMYWDGLDSLIPLADFNQLS